MDGTYRLVGVKIGLCFKRERSVLQEDIKICEAKVFRSSGRIGYERLLWGFWDREAARDRGGTERSFIRAYKLLSSKVSLKAY